MDDYIIDGNLAFSDQRSALKFYREQYHKKKEWQGLTLNELLEIDHANQHILDIAKAIEAKLKEKNS